MTQVTDLENRQDRKGIEIIISTFRGFSGLNCAVIAPPGGHLPHLLQSFRNVTKGLICFGKDGNYFDTLLRKIAKVCEN